MKKEWYVIFLILFGLPLCGLFISLFIPFTNLSQNITEIREKPERIVSLAPNLTEILFELGLNQNIVNHHSHRPVQVSIRYWEITADGYHWTSSKPYSRLRDR